jgi:hypothetical protein
LAKSGRRQFNNRARAGQRHRIQDQHDLAVTEHRRPIDTDHARKLRADVLDDDFLVAHQARRPVPISSDRRCAAAGPSTVGAVRDGRLLLAEQMRQVAERVVVPHPFGSSGFANSAQRRFLEIEHLLDHHRRNRVRLLPARTISALVTASVSGM